MLIRAEAGARLCLAKKTSLVLRLKTLIHMRKSWIQMKNSKLLGFSDKKTRMQDIP